MDPDLIEQNTDTAPPEADPADAMMAAMDEGIAAATDEPAPEPVADEPVIDEPAADPIPGTEPTQEQKDADAAAALEAAKADKPDTEAEITSLGLKEKAAERFRALTSQVAELKPLQEALAAAGIKTVADLPKFVEKAQAADDLIGMVTDSGADAEQFGLTLDYLKILNAGTKGDMKAAEQAYAIAMGEVTNLAKLLGKEVPGVHDPLAEHADLRAEVEEGDITRKRALEIAATRQQQAVQTNVRQQSEQQNQQSQQQTQAIEQGKAALVAIDQQLAASDPHYGAKRAALSAQVAQIRQTYPPHLWASTTQMAYAAIPNPAPAPAPAPKLPLPGPIRGNGPRPPMAPTTMDPMEALSQGIAAASGG